MPPCQPAWGMTRFGKHLDQSIKQLGGAPVLEAIRTRV